MAAATTMTSERAASPPQFQPYLAHPRTERWLAMFHTRPYPGPGTSNRRTPGPTALLGALVIALVGLQIAYPLTRAALRDDITVAIVVTFALTCALHVAVTRGLRRAGLVVAVTALPGYLIELLGVHTGFPFGSYRYSDVFGPRVLDVPLVIGLAWTMLCWPAALAARRLVSGRVARVLVGAWATAAGDLFLDPQMVTTGAWSWLDPAVHLPGVPDVALSNYAGWLLVTLVLSALVQAVMGDGADAVGIGLYLWSWVAWTTALAVFLDLPIAALWGAAAMGTVAVPITVGSVRRARRLRHQVRPARPPERGSRVRGTTTSQTADGNPTMRTRPEAAGASEW